MFPIIPVAVHPLDHMITGFTNILFSTLGACYKVDNIGSLTTRVAPNITKTCLYNFDPLKPHFYIVKLGFTGVYITFHISAQNIDCGYSFEPPHRGGSNEYP